MTKNSKQTNIFISDKKQGKILNIGNGFSGLGFRHTDFGKHMDPLIMVDHYTMTEPTFGAHPHAGMSAVSVLFEDSEGKFHNRDSLGNDFDISAGDLYWLKAGSGALHDESPRPASKIHGLQLFVNLPIALRHSQPESLHVPHSAMPIIKDKGQRIRLVLGTSNGITGVRSPALPFTILDGYLEKQSHFSHSIPADHHSWIYAVNGDITIELEGNSQQLLQGESLVVSSSAKEANITITAQSQHSHFVLLSGQPLREHFVQKGPFVMSTESELKQVEQAYQAGQFGSLNH